LDEEFGAGLEGEQGAVREEKHDGGALRGFDGRSLLKMVTDSRGEEGSVWLDDIGGDAFDLDDADVPAERDQGQEQSGHEEDHAAGRLWSEVLAQAFALRNGATTQAMANDPRTTRDRIGRIMGKI
jgi:hypothetical protein